MRVPGADSMGTLPMWLTGGEARSLRPGDAGDDDAPEMWARKRAEANASSTASTRGGWESLTSSIENDGVAVPVSVRTRGVQFPELVDGHHRVAAVNDLESQGRAKRNEILIPVNWTEHSNKTRALRESWDVARKGEHKRMWGGRPKGEDFSKPAPPPPAPASSGWGTFASGRVSPSAV
jgi:hypothetical protein